MRTLLYTVTAVTILLVSSCGKSGELGSVNGSAVTTDEYLSVFNNLPADLQVEVLEPGGRMELMTRIVMKKSLLAAWEEDPSVSNGWEDLYRVSLLADSVFNRIGMQFDSRAYTDSIAACGYSGFSLQVVLVDDSAGANEIADQWNSGNFDISAQSMVAPWSLEDGSSYRIFSGPVQRITNTFLPLLTMEHGVAHVIPMYGEWCVGLLNLTEGDWLPDERAPGMGLLAAVASATPHVVLSRGISSLTENCTLSENRLVPSGAGTQEPVVLLEGDTLTVADILDVMSMADPANFPGEVSAEIAMFSPPELFAAPEVTLWFYVESLAQRYSLAELAEQQGIVLPENALDFARAESVVRARVLESSIPDSAGVIEWFEDNTDLFLVPERRSVLLGYTDSTATTSYGSVSSFDDLPDCQTVVDRSGVMVPTPPQVEQAFGELLGPEIFAADTGVFTGPVDLDGELAGWFEVVEIVPPETASLEDVYSQAELMAASTLFSSGFDSLMEELYARYSVTVDTSAVEDIDLWGSTR
ncbi:hypothetical protein DRQ21_03440 [Candidatus Fermentibacteria bacterium]|nr:MAG: hypothetical protein DRQ21_03440 [Candidatus Fermentibacteria bacterium]